MNPVAQDSRCVLLHVAHQNRVPRRLQGAALRILGVFPDMVSLRQHAEKHFSQNDLDLVVVPLRKWIAVLRHTQDPKTDELKHIERLATSYRLREREHEDEFRENVSKQKTGVVSSNTEPPRGGLAQGAEDEKISELREAPNVERSAELRLQKFAVMSIMPDYDEVDTSQQQPCVLVWGAFDSEETAREAIKHELSIVARNVHLDTVTMYEWLPLTDLDVNQLKEEFRDESLTGIMQSRKDEQLHVRQYRSLCEQRGQAPSVMDLSQPGSSTAHPDLPLPLEAQECLKNNLLAPDSCENAPEEGCSAALSSVAGSGASA